MPAHPEGSGSPLGEQDLHYFNEGTHDRLWQKLGAHPLPDGRVHFAVWAPDAEAVAVVGPFNGWDPGSDPLAMRGRSGIWEGTVAEAGIGELYKFRIHPRGGGPAFDKADPFGFHHEVPPGTASRVWKLDFEWGDDDWRKGRSRRNALDAPVSVYEVHLGSWQRDLEAPVFRTIADRLVDHVTALGFTHVELMPVMEHPFGGSWGYQVTGYFAPTARWGTPQDLMHLIDSLHRAGIGVILDWVPAHFPDDPHGLARFDGTHLFEHEDPRLGRHPDWDSLIFNYGRNEVRAFLLSSARFWLDVYHADGLRVDGVASMLYLDYSRAEGEWIPNEHGGRENLAAISFLRQLNEAVYREHPDVQTIAEESTSWPMVSRPTTVGGLGFGMKWDMGWMHDTLQFMRRDPVHRCHHHGEITFRAVYAFHENFVLPLSHDEVVHGKGSLLGKMPGDVWRRLANLRALLAYQYACPGKKLLFMGAELAQQGEWDHDGGLEWALLEQPGHRGVYHLVADCNRILRSEPALHELDCEPTGFEWVVGDDAAQSIVAFLRKARGPGRPVLVVGNFTPRPRTNYRVGVPVEGGWSEILNTDSRHYGGSGWGNMGGLEAAPAPFHGRPWSLNLTLPPLAVVMLAPVEAT